METRRTPGQRAGLTQPAVLAAARGVLAAGGLEGLTMRAVAGSLGVAPNALYSHVASKTALIDDVLDDVLASVEPGRGLDADPVAGLEHMMLSTYRTLVAQPDLVALYPLRQGARGPNAQRLGAVMFDLLAALGVTGRRAHEARRVLIVFTIGFAAFGAVAPDDANADHPVSAAEALDNFAKGLRWILAGITSA